MQNNSSSKCNTKINPDSKNDKENKFCSIEEMDVDSNHTNTQIQSNIAKCEEGKDDIDFRSLIVKHLTKLRKTIEADEERFKIFDDSEKLLSFPNEIYSEMSAINLESALDRTAQNVVERVNKYYNKLREMEDKITKLNRGLTDQIEIVKQKNLELKALEKLQGSKTSKQTDETPFKSLNPVSKRNEIQITQMTEDIKTLEKENEDLVVERSALKKELRACKTKCEGLKDENCEMRESKERLEFKIQNLKKKINESSHSDDDEPNLKMEVKNCKKKLINQNEKIKILEDSLKDKDKELNLLKEFVENVNQPCSGNQSNNLDKDSEIERLNKSNSEKDIEISYLKAENEEMTLKIQKKNDAFDLIRRKLDDSKLENKSWESKNDKLKTSLVQCENKNETLTTELNEVKKTLEQCESEKKNKQDALIKLQSKIKDFRSNEEEIQNMKKLKTMLATKEDELSKLSLELDEFKKKLEEKNIEYDILKKENYKSQEEVKALKLLTFQKN